MKYTSLAEASQKAEALCREHELEILEQRDIPYGRLFKVRKQNDTAQFNVYFGKKGLNLVAQGSDNPAKKAVEELFAHMTGGGVSSAPGTAQATVPNAEASNSAGKAKSYTTSEKSYTSSTRSASSHASVRFAYDEPWIGTDESGKPNSHKQYQIRKAYDEPWIGSDESGKGDFFGGLITAGVIVDPEAVPLLQALGVDDSKKINDSKIRTIATEIRKICYGKYKVLALHPTRYNDLYERLKSEGKNLNSLLAWAHVSVLENLLEKQMVRLAITDKFADEKYINSRLKKLGREIDLIQVPKAEYNIAVAAASILARDAFLQWHEDVKKQYGIVFPKGASSLVVKAGKSFVKAKGAQELRNVAKLHFKTYEEVTKY